MSLPTSFQVYKAPKYSSWSKTKEYHIGTTPNTPPLYTCKEVISWSSKFTLDLHKGSTTTTTDGSPIAKSSSGSIRKNQAVITIPVGSSQHSNDDYSSQSSGGGEVSEPFRRHASLTHETWDFVIAVTTGGERHAEKFEWRRSHGDETAALREGKSTHGWKLVRLHSGDNSAGGGIVRNDSRVLGESSDGKEVVAVWTDDTQTWFRGSEKGVVGKLEFTGSGALSGDGGLGEQWKLFVAMSALHMRQVSIQYAQASGTASSTAAVNAAVAGGVS